MKNPLARRSDPLIRKLTLLNEQETGPLLGALGKVQSPVVLGFLNQHGYNIAQQQPRVFGSFAQMNYLLRDGVGIKLACLWHGVPPKANLNGSDFIPRLADYLIRDKRVEREFFVMGTQEPWLSDGAQRLFRGQPFHAIDGFREPDDYVDFFNEHHLPGRQALIVLAMGMPKQEEVALRLRRRLDSPAIIVCGGAVVDFAARRVPRAPMVFRRCGMEWLYRLFQEPRRLFGRYVVGIPLFFFHVGWNGLGITLRGGRRWRVLGREN